MTSVPRVLGRGLVKRCPRCGHGRLFRRWFTMVDRCPGCGLRFEREEGYWVGAMIVNIAVAQLVLGGVLITGFVIFLPDVPVLGLTLAAIAAAAVVPVVFYPWSKTMWVAVDILLHRMDVQDRDASGNGHGAGEVVRGPLTPGRPTSRRGR